MPGSAYSTPSMPPNHFSLFQPVNGACGESFHHASLYAMHLMEQALAQIDCSGIALRGSPASDGRIFTRYSRQAHHLSAAREHNARRAPRTCGSPPALGAAPSSSTPHNNVLSLSHRRPGQSSSWAIASLCCCVCDSRLE